MIDRMTSRRFYDGPDSTDKGIFTFKKGTRISAWLTSFILIYSGSHRNSLLDEQTLKLNNTVVVPEIHRDLKKYITSTTSDKVIPFFKFLHIYKIRLLNRSGGGSYINT